MLTGNERQIPCIHRLAAVSVLSHTFELSVHAVAGDSSTLYVPGATVTNVAGASASRNPVIESTRLLSPRRRNWKSKPSGDPPGTVTLSTEIEACGGTTTTVTVVVPGARPWIGVVAGNAGRIRERANSKDAHDEHNLRRRELRKDGNGAHHGSRKVCDLGRSCHVARHAVGRVRLDHDTNVTPTGSGSLIFTLVASPGPRFFAVMV